MYIYIYIYLCVRVSICLGMYACIRICLRNTCNYARVIAYVFDVRCT